MANKSSYEQKNLTDGSKNPKYIDMLDEDKPIANQKFACISFVSPATTYSFRNLIWFRSF